MRAFTSLALVAALGLGAATLSKPADAAAVVHVGVGLPGLAVSAPVVAPVMYAGAALYPYYRGPRFYPGWRYGYGWRRGGYHGRPWR